MPRLLIVHHTPSPAVRALLESVLAGARQPELSSIEVRVEPALSATASDVLEADAYLLITPANIGYMSGALKHFFDVVYYPCLDATRGRPWGLLLHGNDNVTGAERSVNSITGALGWQRVAATVVTLGPPQPADLAAARELGATVAAAIAPG